MNFFCKKTLHKSIKNAKILALSSMLVCAGETFAQQQVINFSHKQLTLKELFKHIEKQSNFSVGYNHSKVSKVINKKINVSSGKMQDVLSTALKEVGMTYTLDGNHIIIVPAKENSGQKGEKKRIKGRILDVKGEPVIGATVMEEGTTNGTITDIDGNFDFQAHEGGVLEISFVGFKSQRLVAKSNKQLSVVLKEDAEVLDQVVVTALGIKREEKALGYAVQKVGGDNLQTVKPVDIATSLTGKVAGLNVRNSTEFNDAPSIKLRGESPLIVIDGVPYGNISLRDIAADDIESIDVLKGATASALYGSRAGSGAVMITTRKGNKEGLNISVNSSTMFNAGYLVLPEVQTSYSTGMGGKYTAADYVWGDKMDIGRTAVQYDPKTHEWREMPLVSKGKNNYKNFLENSFVTNNNISISQKGKYGSFRTSLSHVYNKGQYPNQKLNKITYSIGGEMKWGKLSLEGGAIYNKRFYPNDRGAGYGSGGYIYNMLIWSGTDFDVRDYKDYWIKKDQVQNWMNNDWYDNPYFLANEWTSSNDYDKINAYASGKYDVLPWLNVMFRTGIDAYADRRKSKTPISKRGYKKGAFSISKDTGFSLNSDFVLSAKHSFGKLDVDGMLGGAIYYYFDDGMNSSTRNGLSIPGYYSLKSSVDPVSASSWIRQRQLNSVYGKLSLSWDGTFFVDVTGRNDWSSTLEKDVQSYFYPSVSGSIVLSQLLDLPDWLSFWKIRGSWTVTKGIPDIYEINQTYSISTNVWNGMNTASYPSAMRSKTLLPSTSRSYEIGTAFNLLNNRLRFDVAYYNKLNYNLTRYATVSNASGFSSTLVNYDEEQERRGWEVSATASLIDTKDWKWDMNVNWARDRYYYHQVDPLYSTQKPWVAAGERWDWYGVYDWERDPQGNIIHKNGLPVKSDYQSVIGYEYPDWIWGVNSTLKYKNWSLYVAFDGRVGGMAKSWTEQAMWNSGVHPDSDNKWRYDEVVNGKNSYIGNGVKVVSGTVEYDTNGKIIKDDRVFAPNDIPVSYENYIRTYYPNAYSTVSNTVYDCTFLKMRELSVTYDVPKSFCEKLKLNNASLSLVGQNLFIWMKEFKYSDPDVDSDNLNSPSNRYIGFNVKLNF